MRHLTIAACALLTGCATSLRLEVEHVSHPTVGWPIEPQGHTEDDLTQLGVLLHWQRDAWYLDAGLGANLQGHNGGGFYGPTLTGTVRAGYELVLK